MRAVLSLDDMIGPLGPEPPSERLWCPSEGECPPAPPQRLLLLLLLLLLPVTALQRGGFTALPSAAGRLRRGAGGARGLGSSSRVSAVASWFCEAGRRTAGTPGSPGDLALLQALIPRVLLRDAVTVTNKGPEQWTLKAPVQRASAGLRESTMGDAVGQILVQTESLSLLGAS
ncbi:hypothetical protein EYF80_059126 [Liparis tanakae]|uniref:Uncharacterized protein n=1 Tax=Liparis tanakae TaxID=230148 RepID=A0A4Z2ER09_9TELE|nr:hypothetical protein EYF80_059126 [Liparis tanakae]